MKENYLLDKNGKVRGKIYMCIPVLEDSYTNEIIISDELKEDGLFVARCASSGESACIQSYSENKLVLDHPIHSEGKDFISKNDLLMFELPNPQNS